MLQRMALRLKALDHVPAHVPCRHGDLRGDLGISRDLRGDLHVDYAKEAIAQEVCLALALALTLTLTMLPSNGGGPSP